MAKPATKPKVDVPAAKSKSSQPGDNSVTPDQLKSFYRDMLLIRRFEERAGQLYGMGLIGGFCHLYIGQEAVVVGMQSTINGKDAVITWSPGLSAICIPTTTASWPMYRWQKPPIRPMP